MDKLTKNDRTMLESLLKTPATFTFAPCGRGGTHTKLVRSSTSPKVKKALDTFASAGLVARKESGDPTGTPPEMTLTYSLTALGREAIDAYAPIMPPKNMSRAATDTELLADAQG